MPKKSPVRSKKYPKVVVPEKSKPILKPKAEKVDPVSPIKIRADGLKIAYAKGEVLNPAVVNAVLLLRVIELLEEIHWKNDGLHKR